MPTVRLAPDGRGFVLVGPDGTARPFVPWGLNYDHDERGRLLEDYWVQEWDRVERDFRRMRALGANVVRVHLQVGRFMEAPDRPRGEALDRFGRLLRLAERERLYLDVTGLGCYHKADVPAWYDRLPEADRWAVQARFWEAVAGRGAGSPAVFCYDLMNEPVVPGGEGRRRDWLGPAFAGKHFVQFIALERRGRRRRDIARAWVRRMTAAVRRADPHHLVTVGLVSWSLEGPGLTSGFVPEAIAGDLDFLCVHLYPERGKVDEALATLRRFAVGRPVVVEEMFPLRCGIEDLARFVEGSRGVAAGWLGFFWGQMPEDLDPPKTVGEALTRAWLVFFRDRASVFRRP